MSKLQADGIYHITAREDWEAALDEGVYLADSLQSDGFIHCSTGAQVFDTANLWFAGQRGLLLLEILPEQTGAEIRYEGVPGGALFPHLYGPLPLAAVTRVLRLEPDADGQFTQPGEEWSA